MGETLFDRQTRWLGHVLLAETRSSSESEERDLVTIVEYEGRLGHLRRVRVRKWGEPAAVQFMRWVWDRDYQRSR